MTEVVEERAAFLGGRDQRLGELGEPLIVHV